MIQPTEEQRPVANNNVLRLYLLCTAGPLVVAVGCLASGSRSLLGVGAIAAIATAVAGVPLIRLLLTRRGGV